MTKQEILRDTKPILFNTEMVRAILEGRKSVTRRKVKQDTGAVLNSPARLKSPDVHDNVFIEKLCPAPYEVGDILYVRETWEKLECTTCKTEQCVCYPSIESNFNYGFAYKADTGSQEHLKWRPSIHMPKEAARIFLRVTDVTAERLQEANLPDFLDEGVVLMPEAFNDPSNAYLQAKNRFSNVWDSTIKKAELDRYGWNANPWVWVIEFERVTI